MLLELRSQAKKDAHELKSLKALLVASDQELVRIRKRGRIEEDKEEEQEGEIDNEHEIGVSGRVSKASLDRGSKRPKKFHEEKSLIFQALAELEKEIENVGNGLGNFVQSTESMLQRMKSSGK